MAIKGHALAGFEIEYLFIEVESVVESSSKVDVVTRGSCRVQLPWTCMWRGLSRLM